jgi:hypothetical protein
VERAQPTEQPGDQFRDAHRRGRVRAGHPASGGDEIGQQPGQAVPGRADHFRQVSGGHDAGQGSQRADDRRERQPLGPEFDAVPGQHDEPCADGPGLELLRQPGLADPRLAADDGEHGVSPPRPFHRVGQFCQFPVAADEDRADDPATHRQNAATSGHLRTSRGRSTSPHIRADSHVRLLLS